MANLKISQLAAIAEADVVSADVLAVADISATETKKITAADLVKAGARLNAGPVTFGDDVVITGDLTVNGTSTTIESTTVVVDDKNIELGAVATPTDVTADGGGITLRGATNKTLNWVNATDAWTSSEHVDLASGKSYYINGSQVLSSTTLGSGVTGSSLTSLGTVTTGTWSASTIAVDKGGTGQTSYTNGQLLIGNSTGNTLTKATLTAGAGVTITNGNGSITIAAAGSGGTVTGVTGTAPIASSGGTAPDISLSLKANGGLVTETNALAVDLGASSITGTLGVADGGTGQTTYTDGQLLIGNSTGNTLTKATLSAGTGITITNGSGSISVAGTAASTSVAGVVQLTDSTSSTSTTTAATPNSVKSAYDLANAALPKAGGTLTGDVTLNAQSDLRFADADSSNWVAFQAPATVASNITWTLPSADGTASQVLSTNGSGTLSWTTPASGAGLDTAQTWTKGQRGEITALTDGATITPDFSDSNNYSVTLGGNRTLANPTNLVAGQSGCIWITQDGTGSRTLAYGSYWDFTGGTAPTLTTTANARDCLVYAVQSATQITAQLITNLS
jgi:uncharacterized Zn ribbon protein